MINFYKHCVFSTYTTRRLYSRYTDIKILSKRHKYNVSLSHIYSIKSYGSFLFMYRSYLSVSIKYIFCRTVHTLVPCREVWQSLYLSVTFTSLYSSRSRSWQNTPWRQSEWSGWRYTGRRPSATCRRKRWRTETEDA